MQQRRARQKCHANARPARWTTAAIIIVRPTLIEITFGLILAFFANLQKRTAANTCSFAGRELHFRSEQRMRRAVI